MVLKCTRRRRNSRAAALWPPKRQHRILECVTRDSTVRRRLTDRISVARTAEQRPRLYALVCLAVTTVGCGSTPTASLDASVVSAYLERALDIMQQNSVNRYKIDWPPLRARAVERASGATRTAGTYSAFVSHSKNSVTTTRFLSGQAPPRPEKPQLSPVRYPTDSALPIWLATS